MPVTKVHFSSQSESYESSDAILSRWPDKLNSLRLSISSPLSTSPIVARLAAQQQYIQTGRSHPLATSPTRRASDQVVCATCLEPDGRIRAVGQTLVSPCSFHDLSTLCVTLRTDYLRRILFLTCLSLLMAAALAILCFEDHSMPSFCWLV